MARDEPEYFEWDERKSARNAKTRGLDFELAARVFAGSFPERVDQRRDYGESRFVAIGKVDGVILTVVRTPRHRARRIISAWPASRQERRMYREYCTKE